MVKPDALHFLGYQTLSFRCFYHFLSIIKPSWNMPPFELPRLAFCSTFDIRSSLSWLWQRGPVPMCFVHVFFLKKSVNIIELKKMHWIKHHCSWFFLFNWKKAVFFFIFVQWIPLNCPGGSQPEPNGGLERSAICFPALIYFAILLSAKNSGKRSEGQNVETNQSNWIQLEAQFLNDWHDILCAWPTWFFSSLCPHAAGDVRNVDSQEGPVLTCGLLDCRGQGQKLHFSALTSFDICPK